MSNTHFINQLYSIYAVETGCFNTVYLHTHNSLQALLWFQPNVEPTQYFENARLPRYTNATCVGNVIIMSVII